MAEVLVRNLIWDTGLLAWVPQTGSGAGPATDVNVLNFPASVAVTFSGPTSAVAANITGDGSSKVIQAANASRKGWSIWNDSGVTVYVKLGTGASATSAKIKLVNQTFYALPMPVYTGVIEALWASGDVRVSEET